MNRRAAVYCILIMFHESCIVLKFWKNYYLCQESTEYKWLWLRKLGSWDLKFTSFLIPFSLKHRIWNLCQMLLSSETKKFFFRVFFPGILDSFACSLHPNKFWNLWVYVSCLFAVLSGEFGFLAFMMNS